jgi:hypothetical protein
MGDAVPITAVKLQKLLTFLHKEGIGAKTLINIGALEYEKFMKTQAGIKGIKYLYVTFEPQLNIQCQLECENVKPEDFVVEAVKNEEGDKEEEEDVVSECECTSADRGPPEKCRHCHLVEMGYYDGEYYKCECHDHLNKDYLSRKED